MVRCGQACSLAAEYTLLKKGSSDAVNAAQGDAGLDWEVVAAEAGWTSAECALQHPLRLKKNERDAQAVKKVCLEYIRQLRALGWFLNQGLAR